MNEFMTEGEAKILLKEAYLECKDVYTQMKQNATICFWITSKSQKLLEIDDSVTIWQRTRIV